MKKNLPLLLFILIIFQCLTGNNSYAEGRGAVANSTDPLYGAAAQEGVFNLYAYTQAGEQIDWNIARTRSSGSDGKWTITVYSPIGLVSTCTINSSTIGTSCTTSKITVTAATAGIWTLIATPASRVNNDAVSFDLSVYTSASVPITGRVYTDGVHGLDNQTPVEPDFTLYFLTPSGYQYSATYRGLNGLNYTIVSDNYGVRTSTTQCVSAYRSISYTGTSYSLGPDSASCGQKNKIFFNSFDAALPASAPRFNTTTGSGQIIEPLVFAPLVPTLSVPTFTRTDSCKQAGTLTFSTTNFSGTGFIYYDVNNNGVFTDPGDIIDTVNFSDGLNTFSFDGLDALGNIIPVSQSINIEVAINKVGETHFVMSDIELLDSGISVTRLNGADAPDNTLYWNDEYLSAATNCSTTPVLDGTGGFNSSAGVHGWHECSTCSPPSASCGSGANSTNTPNENQGSWGNQRLIDNWTYIIPLGLTNTINVPATVYYDYGDLLATWPQARALTGGKDVNGDCIINNADISNTSSVWAGGAINFEPSQHFSSNASGDMYDDGLGFPGGPLNQGATYYFTVDVNSNASNKTVYYGLWFDWNNNTSFADDVDCNGSPAFYSGNGVTPSGGGINIVTVPICVPTDALEPGGVSGSDYKVRLIVSDAPVTSSMYGATISNGEIEDYQLPLTLLPVTFSSFNATENNCNVLLNFETYNESNNSHFDIEHSIDGKNWSTVTTIKAKNQGPEYNVYQYTDAKAAAGQNFYRIKQVDISGAYQYSKTITINNTCGNTGFITYPNPVEEKLTVVLPPGMQNVQMKIINTLGQTMTTNMQANADTYNFNTQEFAPGLYILQVIQNGGQVYQSKFIKE